MGMIIAKALFNDMPDFNVILGKFYQQSKLRATIETNKEVYSSNIHIVPYGVVDVLISISFTKGTTINVDGVFIEYDTICISECLNDEGCEYYVLMVLYTILIDMGGMDKKGRLLSETANIPTWSREEWQGEDWFKKVSKRPTLFNILVEKIRLFFKL